MEKEELWKKFDELRKRYKILKQVAKILRVKEEDVIKTVKRFLSDLEKFKS